MGLKSFKVIYNGVINEFNSLDDAMSYAKVIGRFVRITSDSFEVCGVFGVDSIKNGVCPDGIAYDWNKANRIGRVKKERAA